MLRPQPVPLQLLALGEVGAQVEGPAPICFRGAGASQAAAPPPFLVRSWGGGRFGSGRMAPGHAAWAGD